MKTLKKRVAAAILSGVMLLPSATNAGVPVIDGANLINAIQQLMAWMEQYNQMVQSLESYKNQLAAIKGGRGMGVLLGDKTIRQAIPADYLKAFDQIRYKGLAGASGAAKILYGKVKVYGCDERFSNESLRINCEAQVMTSAESLALVNQSIERSKLRADAIGDLVAQIDGAVDVKASADLQNRIGAEIAMLQNEKTMLDMAMQQQQREYELTQQRNAEMGMKRLLKNTVNPFN